MSNWIVLLIVYICIPPFESVQSLQTIANYSFYLVFICPWSITRVLNDFMVFHSWSFIFWSFVFKYACFFFHVPSSYYYLVPVLYLFLTINNCWKCTEDWNSLIYIYSRFYRHIDLIDNFRKKDTFVLIITIIDCSNRFYKHQKYNYHIQSALCWWPGFFLHLK